MFACFVDFGKAFDNVNYWKLLNKCWTMGWMLDWFSCWHIGTFIRKLL